MKRRISVLLLAGMLLLLTACGGVVRPPVRIGEATGNASFNRSYSLTEDLRRLTLWHWSR